jgi:Tol biopolymer transport system component
VAVNTAGVRRGLLAGIASLVWVTVITLVIAALTESLDGVLALGTHRSGPSDLVAVNINGTDRTVLIPGNGLGHWGPAWSPKVPEFVYTLGNPNTNVGQLMLVMTGGLDSAQRAVTHDRRNNYLAAWSHDGQRIAYITQRGQDTSTAELAVIGPGDNPKQLTHNRAWEYGTSWSPDGKWIAYGSEQGGSWHVWLIHPDGTGAHILAGTGGGNAPDWSPDGRSILFTSDRSGTDDLYVVPATGGAARRLTAGPCHNDNGRWSPDGKRIAYATFCNGGWNDIAVMNANGGGVRNLTNTPNVEEEVPSWLPDGKRVGFTVFAVVRDSIWPGAVLRALGIGLLAGLLVGLLTLLWSRRVSPTTPR